ncbi:MAG: hypothetical protein U0354_14565 [Candidatus Sericytochromatia bacterium]
MLNSCASTIINSHKIGTTKELCSKKSVLVFWGTAWRDNQKEKNLREEIASKAINKYFSNSKCFSDFKVVKNLNNKESISLSDTELLNQTKDSKIDKIITIRIEELGPILNLNLGLVLVEGATEVKLRVKVIDIKTSSIDYDNSIDWKNGGAYIIKGIGTLESDMIDLLLKIFESNI